MNTIAPIDLEDEGSEGRFDAHELTVILLTVGLGVLVFVVVNKWMQRRRARWLRGDDIVINIQGFRDEDIRGGAQSVNGNMLFPGMAPARFD